MKTRKILLAIGAAVALGAAGAGLYWIGMSRGMKIIAPVPASADATPSQGAPATAAGVDPSTGRKVLYWHDPMVPGQKFDKPGKSPFMDMQLVPVYAQGEGDEGSVAISPRVQQNLGIRTAEVVRGTLAPVVEAVGNIAYNERDVAVVQARGNGFVEKLHVRAVLDPVRKGQPLADLYVPDWVAAQEEFLSAQKIAARSGLRQLDSLVDGARQRMRLAGMSDEQIRLVEAGGKVQPRLTLVAPIGGVVGELAAREGMTVMSGAALFRINGLATVWVNAEVPEALAAQVRPGNVVDVRASALPGTKLAGRVNAILPEVNAATRTLKARIEISNPQGKLVPGMFATVNFTPAARGEALLVPSEAVIQTGKRSVVFVAQGEGRFAPAEVQTGIESNGQTEIREGLEAGQRVVVSGQFLVDSEASLKGTQTRMGEAAPARAAAPTHRGQGVVESVDAGEVMLSHEPIASMQWGAMTMGFKLPANVAPKVAPGDRVSFEFRQVQDGSFEITRLEALAKGLPK